MLLSIGSFLEFNDCGYNIPILVLICTVLLVTEIEFIGNLSLFEPHLVSTG